MKAPKAAAQSNQPNQPNQAWMATDNETGDVDEQAIALIAPLCRFAWVQGEPLPLIYEPEHEIYTRRGIDLQALQHLKALGLISLEPAGYVKKKLGRHTRLFYFGRATKIQFPFEADNQLDLGHVLLTEKGKVLAARAGPTLSPDQEFYEYVIGKWFQQGLIVSTILKIPDFRRI